MRKKNLFPSLHFSYAMYYHSNAMHHIQPNSLDVWKGLYNIYYEMKWAVCGTKTIYSKTLFIFYTTYKDKWHRSRKCSQFIFYFYNHIRSFWVLYLFNRLFEIKHNRKCMYIFGDGGDISVEKINAEPYTYIHHTLLCRRRFS